MKVCSVCKVEHDNNNAYCKPCLASYAKAWREKNKDDISDKRKKYKQSNKERIKESSREYIQANRDAILDRQRSPEYRDKAKAWEKRWRDDNRDKCREKWQRYKARKINATVEEVDYQEIRERDNSICYICGIVCVNRIDPRKYQPDEIHLDHVISLINGGAHSMSNIKVSCGSCNLKKSATDLATRLGIA